MRHVSNYVHLDEVSLEIDQEYVVYGVIFREGVPWYYICEDEADEYPRPHFGGFFEVVNIELSRFWNLVWQGPFLSPAALLPDKWAEDEMFYEKLVDGNHTETLIFRDIKLRLDEEVRRGSNE